MRTVISLIILALHLQEVESQVYQSKRCDSDEDCPWDMFCVGNCVGWECYL